LGVKPPLELLQNFCLLYFKIIYVVLIEKVDVVVMLQWLNPPSDFIPLFRKSWLRHCLNDIKKRRVVDGFR